MVWSAFFCAVMVWFLAPSTSLLGGNGRFHNGAFDIIVTLDSHVIEADIVEIRERLTEASRILFDATDGQARLGHVFVLKNNVGREFADMFIQKTRPTSPSNRDANVVGRIGQVGLKGVYLWTDDDIEDSVEERAAITIAHEFGHYFFDLRDEYRNAAGRKRSSSECVSDRGSDEGCTSPGSPVSTPAPFSACLMDNFKRSGRYFDAGSEPVHTVTEFCWSGNHDPDCDTYQHALNGKSCWETIAEAYDAIAAPTSEGELAAPQEDPLPDCSATITENCFSPPDFTVPETPVVKVVLLLNNSGSMNGAGIDDTRKIDDLRVFSELFIDLLTPGAEGASLADVELGIISFNHETQTRLESTRLTSDETVIADAKAAVGFDAAGFTNIGAGMRAAKAMLDASTVQGPGIIVLVTDGFHNHPPDDPAFEPLAVLEEIVDERTLLHTVSLGGATDEAALQQISQQSGATYWNAENSVEFAEPLVAIAALAQGGSDLDSPQTEEFEETEEFGSAGRREVERQVVSLDAIWPPVEIISADTLVLRPVFVEEGLAQATFSLVWSTPAERLELIAISPDTTVISRSAIRGGEHPNIELEERDRYLNFTIQEPQTGFWNFAIIDLTPDVQADFLFQPTGINSEVQAYVTAQEITTTVTDSIQLLTVAAREVFAGIQLEAVARDQAPLIDISVVATMTTPTGSIRFFRLVDNGNRELGDRFANDGIYSRLISDVEQSGNGSYQFDVEFFVGSSRAQFLPGEEPDTTDGNGGMFALTQVGEGETANVTPRSFTRHFRAGTVVNELPEDTAGDLDQDGIPDDIEGCGPDDDRDGDGRRNCEDRDSDNDDLADRDEGEGDSDNDGTPDFLDDDSDNDTIADIEDPFPYDASHGLAYGVDDDNQKFVELDLRADPPVFRDIGVVKDAASGREIAEMEALAWDSDTQQLLVFSNRPRALYAIDIGDIPAAGEGRDIPAQLIGEVNVEITALAIHPRSRELFAVESDERLGKLDKTTAVFTPIGDIGFEDVQGLAFSSRTEIKLYGVEIRTNRLLQIDPHTGRGAPVHPSNQTGFEEIESLTFDKTAKLYGFSERAHKFIEISTRTGMAEALPVTVSADFDIEGLAFILDD